MNSIIGRPDLINPTIAEYILHMGTQNTHHNKTYSGPFGRKKT